MKYKVVLLGVVISTLMFANETGPIVEGDAKFFYATNDRGANTDFLGKGSSASDAALRLAASGDLRENVSAGVSVYALSSLGLENVMVSDTWSGARNDGNRADDAAWIGELWIVGSRGKTTLKAGRIQIDTPLIYSEKWSIVPNTFEAAIVLNQDIPDTTVIGMWVGKGNGVNLGAAAGLSADNKNSRGIDRYMAKNARFSTFGMGGAYAAGIVNHSYPPLRAQGWYYNLVNLADALWLQGDIACCLIPDATFGTQLVHISPKGDFGGYESTNAYALRLGYEGITNLKIAIAYSKISDKGVLKIANTATDNLVDADSKLYTETLWNRGYVGTLNAESVKLMLQYALKQIATFEATYVGVNNAHDEFTQNEEDIEEFALSASRTFGSLDTKLAYISSDLEGNANGGRGDTLIGYLTLNF